MSVNKVTLLGNVTSVPKVTTFESGDKVIQIGIATNEKGYTTKDGREIPERTEFHNLVVRKKGLTDVFEKFVKKGNKLYVEGKLRTRAYQDNNGIDRYITEVYVEECELLTPKEKGAPAPPPTTTTQQVDNPFAVNGNGDSDVPF